MPPSVGYAIADVATLTAIGSGDRDEGYARLLLNDGNGRRFWVAYDDAATSGDYQPDDTPATGYWKKVDAFGPTVLRENTTVYVNASTGNDSNDGSSGSPWLTLQKASEYARTVIFNGYSLTIDCSGTFTSGVTYTGGFAGDLIWEGDTANPSNVQVNTTSENAFTFESTITTITVQGFQISTTTGGLGIQAKATDPGGLTVADCDFSGVASHSIQWDDNARGAIGDLTYSGNAASAILITDGARLDADTLSPTITLLSSPVFSTAFILAARNASSIWRNVTFSGTTGANSVRHNVNTNATIDIGGATASTYFPGTLAGTDNGGQGLIV